MNLETLATLHAPVYVSAGGLRGLSETGNLALNKSTSQSSQFPDEPQSTGSGKAVNGNRDGNFANRAISHTGYDKNAWWQVNLGQVFNIDQVDIWNRTDCCSNRLKNFFVLISDVPFQSNDLQVVSQQSGIGKYYVSGPVGTMVSVPIGRTGQYVRIQLVDTEYLALAEVEVYGSAIQTAQSPAPVIMPTGSPSTLDPTIQSPGILQSITDSFSSLFNTPATGTDGTIAQGIAPLATSRAPTQSGTSATGGFFSKKFSLLGVSIPYYVPLVAIGGYLAFKKK